MEPLAGAAPARSPYKEDLQAAAERQRKWWPARVTRPVLRIKSPLHHFNACRPKKWSQSRVLPSAKLAYETGLSAGSIAKWIPHPELHPPSLGATAGQAELARLPSERITENALGAHENGRRETTCTSKAA